VGVNHIKFVPCIVMVVSNKNVKCYKFEKLRPFFSPLCCRAMLRLLDVLLQLDHLKNAKASIPNDFSWYKRTFTQVSANWPDTDVMREELDDLQIFLSTRWTILLNLQAEIFRVNGYAFFPHFAHHAFVGQISHCFKYPLLPI
jgi:hypothetical protein